MNMTKTNYVMIAGSIARSKQITEMTEKNQERKKNKLDMLRLVAHDLAGTFYGDNKKFDRDRFISACGFEGGQ